MLFSDFIGQETLVHNLQSILAQKKVGHAYLFIGREGVGRRTLARLFGQALLCEVESGYPCGTCHSCLLAQAGTHPDFQEIQADGATIKIEQIRQLRAGVALRPLLGDHRVFLIADMERLSEAAANAFLLTLEDPPPGVVFIGWSGSLQALLPTIISRFQITKLEPVEADTLTKALIARNAPPEEAAAAAVQAEGLPGTAIRLLTDGMGASTTGETMLDQLLQADLPEMFGLNEHCAKHENREAIGRRLAELQRKLGQALISSGKSEEPVLQLIPPEGIWRLYYLTARAAEHIHANVNIRLLLDVLALGFFQERGGLRL